ncbi:universal stress protein [Mesorhizobium sp. ESP7-2]|uniref:universal stress protein n=1 Tax=Mesorhizobium sp. ESP7-2 TaxID=2876622 RepID=UPI001CCDED4B|nr:universal stress protein [Mesorhizobium sp. ESP7-2]MBZ9709419.1 universal stress protein [Mesorhizobium sp. ESP7-2]
MFQVWGKWVTQIDVHQGIRPETAIAKLKPSGICATVEGALVMQLLASVFLPTYPDPPGPKVVSNAVAAARWLSAALDVAVVNVDIPDVSNALSRLLLDLPTKIREVEAASRQRGKTLLDAVAAEASRCSVTLTSQELQAQPALMGEAAAKEGRYFDLCMIGWAPNNEASQMIAEEVVFSSGRPTLILPGDEDVGPLDHVVIAWDGSRVAARAVADAKPFLERASAISIITVTDEKVLPREDVADRLAHVLRARGLTAKVESFMPATIRSARHFRSTPLRSAAICWLWADGATLASGTLCSAEPQKAFCRICACRS